MLSNQLLMMMPQGSRAAFDKKTHRRVLLRTTRLNYVYHAAELLEGKEDEDVSQEVLEHLEGAQSLMHRAWGVAEWNRVASLTAVELDQTAQSVLKTGLGEDTFKQIIAVPLSSLSTEDREKAVDALGRKALSEIYRQLLLSVITELWVEYLTQMEALRVSIGLEAYAQRDPLVQYKNRAFGLFQDLLGNMRIGVVSRMFTYRPRDMSAVQTTVSRIEAPDIDEPEEKTTPVTAGAAPELPEKVSRTSNTSKSRRRRKRRK